MCSYNNNILISIPSQPYLMLNRRILCNCDVEAESNFLLESLAACDNSETDLVMYFTVNLAFVNYFDNLIESLDVPILKDWTTQQQVFPISLETFEINSSLLTVPKILKDFVHQFKHKRQIQDLQVHIDEERSKQNSKFSSFLNSFLVDVFLFVAALITIIITLMVTYVICGQSKLKTFVANIALQCIKGTEAANPRFQDMYCACKMQWYIIALLLLMLLGTVFIVTSKIRKSNLFGGHFFSNVTKVILFILDTQLYVPLNLCEIAGSMHIFRRRGRLTPECIKFKRNWILDILEIDWKDVKVTLNGNKLICQHQ